VSLAENQRRDVEAWLAEFQQGWDEKKLKNQVRKLPPSGDPRRLPALLEIVKIDLYRHWEQGRRVKVESYLKAFPELPATGLVPELIQAELAARHRAGVPADLASFAQRFPDQANQLKAIDRSASTFPAPETEAGRYSTCSNVPPMPVPPLPVPSLPVPSGQGAPSLPEQFGRYRILRKLGQGGMGSVYLAHDSQLDRQLALKVPHISASDGPQVLERFYREARAAATLSHPNICPVHDVGTIDGVHFVTMAFIEGKPLSELMRVKGRLPQKSVAAVIRKLALAMQEAHARGIIHRDLKPSNIMINERNEPVIMDFGLARRAQENVRLTQSGAIMGTPAYMPPEQVNGDLKAIGPASDVYSLGVVLYEMLTGRLPFEGPATAVLAAIITRDPLPPSSLRPDLDPALEAICLKTMARQIPDRYGSMRDLAMALTAYIKGESSAKAPAPEVKTRQAGKAAPVAEPAPAAEGLATELLGKLVKRMESDADTIRESHKLVAEQHRRAHWPALLAAVVLMAAVVAIAWVASTAINRPQPTPSVTVTLNLPREVNDPTVILIVLDGKTRTKDELAGPLALSVGKHELKMTRKDGTVLVSRFSVGKELDQKVEVPPPQDEAVARADDAAGKADDGGTRPDDPVAVEEPAPGWKDMFNSKDLNGWSIFPEGTVGWEVQDGVLVGSGPESTLFSHRSNYKNSHFRVEAQINDGGMSAQIFRGRFDPGRPRGYFGVISSNASWGRTGSLIGRGGGAYMDVRDILVKPGEWFIQEVIAEGNHLRVLVNGKKVVDYVDVNKEYMSGFLALLKQGKDTVVKFRKVQIKELPPFRPVVRPGAEPGWVSLFNGKDLSGWKPQAGSTAGWEVRDRVLVGSEPESVLFSQRNNYRNFHFRVVAQINDKGSAAQLFRARFEGGRPAGYYAMIDSTGSWSKTGSIVGRGGGAFMSVPDSLVKPGVWFIQEVIADGNHLVVKLDGEKVVDFIDQHSEHKEGHLALGKLTAATVVKFRTIEVKELPGR
jgi:predicted Ser/Thr protein kinase